MAIDISTAAGPHENSGVLSGGGQHPSGSGRANGSPVGHAGGGSPVARPRFDVGVARDGYRWWYIDATSDDGQHGLTIIGFFGSVFSPYYARARRTGKGDPANHCAINVALYGRPRRWAMTERGATRMARDAQHFTVGKSGMVWDGDTLTITIRERCSPLPFPLRGEVRLSANGIYNAPVQLDAQGKHHWQAVAPHARVSVEMEAPSLCWQGAAYHDMNWGDEPLERGFRHWTWARTNTSRGTEVLYDVERRDGSRFSFGRCFNAGVVRERPVPQAHPLKRGLWGMTRSRERLKRHRI